MVNAAEARKHTREARISHTKLGQRLSELKVPTSHDAWKQHRELGLALNKVLADVAETSTPGAPVLSPAPAPTPVPPAFRKAQASDLTALGIELKVVIDQMREQVQNVE